MSETPSPSSRELYLRLLRYVAPYWRTFALALASLALLAATEPAVPALLKPLLDGSFVERSDRPAWLIPLLLVLLYLIKGVLNYAAHVSMNWVAQKVVMDLREAMFRSLVAQPASFYDVSPSGRLLSKLTFDTAQVTQASTHVLAVLVKDALAVVGLVAYMVWLNWKLSLILLVLAPLVGLVVHLVSRRLRRMSRLVQQSMGEVSHLAQEAIDCHKVVKVFSGQDYEIRRFRRAVNKARSYAMKVVSAAGASVPIVQLIAATGMAVMIYIAVLQSAEDKLSVGGFVAFFVAMGLVLAPLKRLTGVNEHLQRGLAACESIFTLVDAPPEPNQGRLDIGRARGAVRFENVTLNYRPGGMPALSGIDLTVEPGETVALVGPSGGGKSSLVNLLARFYAPNSGRILLDGTDIAEIRLASLRRNIALVTQEVVLFDDSIRANIAYGAGGAVSEEAVLAAAEAAHVMDFVADLPEGLDTAVGSRGLRLSGGQRQRIAIARALVKDAPILILDEATSALDSGSERHVQEALERLQQGRSCFIIAHRLSTVERADRILVLERGRLVESGSHAELLARGGLYARLHQLQFLDAASAAAS